MRSYFWERDETHCEYGKKETVDVFMRVDFGKVVWVSLLVMVGTVDKKIDNIFVKDLPPYIKLVLGIEGLQNLPRCWSKTRPRRSVVLSREYPFIVVGGPRTIWGLKL